MKKRLLLVPILAVLFSQLTGCAVAAIVAAAKYGSAKKIEAKQGCQKNYNEYLKIAKNPISMSQYCGDASYAASGDK